MPDRPTSADPTLDLPSSAALLEASSEALFVLDGAGRVQWSNMTGRAVLDSLGGKSTFEELLHVDSRPAWSAALRKTSAGGSERLRVECSGPPGAPRVLALHLEPAPTGSGGGRALVLARDVTELERARRAEEQVLAGLERLSHGAHVLAHDIKNPVAALHLALRAVARHLGEDEVAVVEELAQRLVQLERSLRRSLGYLRPIELRPELVPIETLVEAALHELAPRIEGTGALLEREVEAGLEVLADPARLTEALVALVLNALEAGSGRVRIRASAIPDGICMEVEDDGPGILPSVRGTLFEPFVTTKEGASGLGLATARKLVEAHGGRLELAPSSLGGALLRVHLERGGIH